MLLRYRAILTPYLTLFFFFLQVTRLSYACPILQKKDLFVQVILYAHLPLFNECPGLYCTCTLEISIIPWELLMFEHYGTHTKSKSFVWKTENEEEARFEIERLYVVLKI